MMNQNDKGKLNVKKQKKIGRGVRGHLHFFKKKKIILFGTAIRPLNILSDELRNSIHDI